MDKSKGVPISDPLPVRNDFRVNGKEAPLQSEIHKFILNNPNCTIKDICNGVHGYNDLAGIRKAIRKMVESHKIRQTFTIT